MNRLGTLLFAASALTAVALASPNLAQAQICAPGDHAQVLWHGTWYPAVVKRARGDGCYIHYSGYNNSWDEWVGPDRIRVTLGNAIAVVDPGPGVYAVGDPVSVLWKGNWWPAHVLHTKGNKLYIHYDGYQSSWDEWVGPARYRRP